MAADHWPRRMSRLGRQRTAYRRGAVNDGQRLVINSRDVLTGAMVKGGIDRAAERAFYRWRQVGGEPGIAITDLQAGIEAAAKALPLERDNLDEYLGWPLDRVAKVVEVRRLSA